MLLPVHSRPQLVGMLEEAQGLQELSLDEGLLLHLGASQESCLHCLRLAETEDTLSKDDFRSQLICGVGPELLALSQGVVRVLVRLLCCPFLTPTKAAECSQVQTEPVEALAIHILVLLAILTAGFLQGLEDFHCIHSVFRSSYHDVLGVFWRGSSPLVQQLSTIQGNLARSLVFVSRLVLRESSSRCVLRFHLQVLRSFDHLGILSLRLPQHNLSILKLSSIRQELRNHDRRVFSLSSLACFHSFRY
mmetsp:Transcript_1352/g.2952  ORF Transcript_1352/g.2952 Transcript_1352/m.2952 type:complete len:248 (+) Transcript_1352:408-1151(+)